MPSLAGRRLQMMVSFQFSDFKDLKDNRVLKVIKVTPKSALFIQSGFLSP